MFNRQLRVDVVKGKKTTPEGGDQLEPTFEDKAMIVANVVERGMRKITVGMVVYIALDTVRKVAVATVKK